MQNARDSVRVGSYTCTNFRHDWFMSIILMGKREPVALLNLFSLCLVMVEWLFLAVRWGCLRFVFVVFPDHTHLLFLFTVVALGPITYLTNGT